MGLMRYLSESRVRLELETTMPSEEEREGIPRDRWLPTLKERVIRELCDLLLTSTDIRNQNKLFLDLHNREKQWSTALGHGVAFPHVRTMHTRTLVFAIGRSTPGLDYDSPDGEPVHVFFSMVAPPYEDQIYRRFAKQLAIAVTYGSLVERVLEVKTPGEMMRLVDDLV
ncbi:PTS sugar transporter subunit IIA [Candidatus Fermentibacteria bacterium]|nr:PTS sugar transporter subunit IIA [Candidatus Fermentibacteria bacterium]